MTSTLKNGLCWALTALQLKSDNLKTQTQVSSSITLKSPGHEQTRHQSKAPTLIEDALEGQRGDENVRPCYRRETVSDHCTQESCWLVINNKVYDVTRFLQLHPGGDDIVLEHGGCDATGAFIDKGHSADALLMLNDYFIGEVVPEDWFPEKNFT